MDATNATEDAPAPANRRCAECGKNFTPAREWQVFCSQKPCKAAFATRFKIRGGPLTPLVLAWNETRHAAPGTEEAAICRYARREISAIAGIFIGEDERAGRTGAVEYVRGLMKTGTLYVDRAQKRPR